MALDIHQLKALERGALLHDIGKIGNTAIVSCTNPANFNDAEWETMRLHPDIGAHIVEAIAFSAREDTLPVIRYHQETGMGAAIPLACTAKIYRWWHASLLWPMHWAPLTAATISRKDII